MRDNRFQHIVDAQPRFGRNIDRAGRIQTDDILNLPAYARAIRRRQIHFIQNRHNLVIDLDCLIDIGERLGLNPLTGVNHKKRTLTRRQ